MTERISNAEFLMVEPRLPTEASGWEVRVISPHDWTTIIGYVRNWRKISGSKELNGFGAGSIELHTTNEILSTPFPAGLSGTIRKGEFLWQFWRDGVLRHEWISDDEKEDEVGDTLANIISFSGRTLEKVLEWAIHRPIWGERQAYDVTGNPTGGTYRLKNPDTGEVTSPIAWNATPAEVYTALWTSLNDIGPGDITVTQGTNGDTGAPFPGRYSIQFLGGLTGVDYPRLEGSDVLLTGGAGKMEIDSAPRDSNNTWEDLNSTILGKPAIASVMAFLDRAKARGVLPFLDITFTATHDSAGMPWSDVTDVTISPGETMLALLQRLSDMLQWEFRVNSGFKLWVVQNTYGVNRSSQVVFFKAGQQIRHERSSSSRDVVTDVFVQSSKFEVAHMVAASPVTSWRREAWIEAGGSPSVSSATAVGNATLAVRKDKKVSRTLTVPPALPTRKVFIDYNVADTVMLETSDGMEQIKIVGLSFSSDPEQEFGLELTIQSAFEAREVRVLKTLEKMGSKGATGGRGSSPTGPPPISRALGFRDLTDVNTAGVRSGDVMVWSGSRWIRVEPTLDFLTNVDAESVANGQALIYDSGLGRWKAGAPTVSMTVDWTDVVNKPATFPPATHTHTADGISDATAVGKAVVRAVDAAAARAAIGAGTGNSNLALGTTGTTAKAGNYVPAWTEITSKPVTFEPIVKTLDWLSDVDTAGQETGEVLTFDGTKWAPAPVAAPPSTLDSLTDVVTAGQAEGKLLGYSGGVWVPVDPPGDEELLTFTAGESSGDNSGNTWASMITNLTVRKEFTLTRLDFYAVDAGTYDLMFDGGVLGTVTASAGAVTSFTGLSTLVSEGTHTIGVDPQGANVRARFRSVASIDYVGELYDMTAAGWTALAGTYTIPFGYYGSVNPTPPIEALDDLTDVDVEGAIAGQVLTFDGTNWVPEEAASGGGEVPVDTMRFRGAWTATLLQDVDITFDSGQWPAGTTQGGNPWDIADQADATAGTTKAARGTGIQSQSRLVTIPVVMPIAGSMWIRYWSQSEANYDWFDVSVDGVNKLHTSGNFVVWQELEITGLSAGQHNVALSFSNDGSQTVGFNAAYVSRIRYKDVDASNPYQLGHVVTHGGKRWVLLAGTGSQEPGTGSDWGLVSAVETLDQLTDVTTSGATDQQVLTWDAATSQWKPAAALAGPEGPEGPEGPVGPAGHNPITVGPSAPATPAVGDIWFDLS